MDKIKELVEQVKGNTERVKKISIVCAILAAISAILAVLVIKGCNRKRVDGDSTECPDDWDETKCDHCCQSASVAYPDCAVDCPEYDSDYANYAKGNCEVPRNDVTMNCEAFNVSCKCPACYLNLLNGGPCTHCSKCEGTPLLNSEVEKEEK